MQTAQPDAPLPESWAMCKWRIIALTGAYLLHLMMNAEGLAGLMTFIGTDAVVETIIKAVRHRKHKKGGVSSG